MRTEKTIVTYTCDFCKQELTDHQLIHSVKLKHIKGEKDICSDCIRCLEETHMLVVHGEVRDKRGGWRQLGVYDG